MEALTVSVSIERPLYYTLFLRVHVGSRKLSDLGLADAPS
jgi:hypothetical protein